jgi:hypothetical protein
VGIWSSSHSASHSGTRLWIKKRPREEPSDQPDRSSHRPRPQAQVAPQKHPNSWHCTWRASNGYLLYCSGRPVSRANRQARPSTTQPSKPLRKSPTRDIPIASDSILPAVQSVPAVIGPAVGSCQAQLFPQEPPQLASASPWLFWAPPPFVDLHPPSRGSQPASTSPTHVHPPSSIRPCEAARDHTRCLVSSFSFSLPNTHALSRIRAAS